MQNNSVRQKIRVKREKQTATLTTNESLDDDEAGATRMTSESLGEVVVAAAAAGWFLKP